MSSDPDADLVRRLMTEFSVDMPAARFAEGFDPDEAEIVPLRADLEDVTYRGRDAPRQFLEAARDSWESLRFEPTEVRRVGNAILAIVRLHARSRGAGVEMDVDVAALARFRGGRIAHLRTYFDVARAREDAEAAEREEAL